MKDVTRREYWEFADRILQKAETMGMYIGLLPAWGSLVSTGILDEKAMEHYANFLGKRFQERKNLIWILGGDIKGDVNYQVFCREAQILKSYNPGRLVTYHPFGRTSSSLWFHEETWLDFNMFQSGHRRYDQQSLGEWDDPAERGIFLGEDNWKYVSRDLSGKIVKPTLDAEPSYEGIPQGLRSASLPEGADGKRRFYERKAG